MLGKAAMIAVLLAPTASIARQDDHRIDANPFSWLNVAVSLSRRCVEAIRLRPLRFCGGHCILVEAGRPYRRAGHQRNSGMSSVSNAILTSVAVQKSASLSRLVRNADF